MSATRQKIYKCDIVSGGGGGGDATAANQVLELATQVNAADSDKKTCEYLKEIADGDGNITGFATSTLQGTINTSTLAGATHVKQDITNGALVNAADSSKKACEYLKEISEADHKITAFSTAANQVLLLATQVNASDADKKACEYLKETADSVYPLSTKIGLTTTAVAPLVDVKKSDSAEDCLQVIPYSKAKAVSVLYTAATVAIGYSSAVDLGSDVFKYSDICMIGNTTASTYEPMFAFSDNNSDYFVASGKPLLTLVPSGGTVYHFVYKYVDCPARYVKVYNMVGGSVVNLKILQSNSR
jgi:hypothetical protein